jgi:hydroxypyruvate isomerase
VPKFAANLSLLFAERPMLERFAAARAAGFDAVEIQFPYEYDPGRLAAAARAASCRDRADQRAGR